MSMIASQAIELLKKGATIGIGPNGAWISTRDGTVSNLNINSFRSLRRAKLLRRVEPPGQFYAVTHWTYRWATP
jgi:hypothetical protein